MPLFLMNYAIKVNVAKIISIDGIIKLSAPKIHRQITEIKIPNIDDI